MNEVSSEQHIIHISAAKEKQLVSTADIHCGWHAACVGVLARYSQTSAADGHSQISSQGDK